MAKSGLPSRTIEFLECHEGYAGHGVNGRVWHIKRVFTGWHLEFKDPGDRVPTYAGTHPTLTDAQHEAER